jgi:hypothetical protein
MMDFVATDPRKHAIRNNNTRAAYLHAISRFFARSEHHQPGQLADIEPLHVAAYIEDWGKISRSRR